MRRTVIVVVAAVMTVVAPGTPARPGEGAEPLFTARPFTEPNSFTAGIEGPGCDAQGNVYAVNFARQGTIGRVTPDGKAEVFVELPGGSVGNGIVFDRQGLMYVADYVNHNVLRIDPKTRAVTTFAHDAGMSQPNDLAIAADGTLYASDPDWNKGTGRLWRIDPSGKVTKLADGLGTTNGIEVSPDGKTLYVNESVQRNVWAFPITAAGLGEKRLVKKFDDHGFDGMRCDVDGNLYVTRYGKGTVVKLAPDGRVLREIDVLGKSPSNLCFGGPDGRTVYVTEVEHRRLVRFRVDRPGLAWQRGQAADGPRTRTFRFTYAATVTGLPQGKTPRVWLPVAVSDADQEVTVEDQELPGASQLGREATYGNRILYLEAAAGKDGTVAAWITYRVTRREVRAERSKEEPEERLVRFLQPDARVPVGGKPLELLKGKQLPADQTAAARELYDVVNGHMRYSKHGTGWGQGDAVWACASGYGNCSDFHSLFISLARAQKIPAKFEIGFGLPPERGSGEVAGYHCWAKFRPAGKGWVPVDISEANKNPKLRDYYFGNLTEDRVTFSSGRDLELVPKQDGPPLNFFVYPYVEVDGKPYPADKVRGKFSYEDLPAGRGS